MNKKEIIQIIDRYFHNKVTEKETEDAIKELSDLNYPVEIENLMTKHWEESAETRLKDKIDLASLLNKIHHRVNTDSSNNKILSSEMAIPDKVKKTPVKLIAGYLSKAAAILFLPLLLIFAYYLFFKSEKNSTSTLIAYNEVYTPMSAKTKLILPDSTTVWLNSGSSLKYPVEFQQKTREVFLSGEGYFDVESNDKVPFVVRTGLLTVTAHGTSFNVMSYPDDQNIETTLVEGNVHIEESGTKIPVNLNPGCQSVFDKTTGKQITKKVDTRFFTSWKDGRLIFRNESMDQVINKLERWFNCSIILENNALKDFRYTATIEMESLTEVFDLISITAPVIYNYNKETREIRIKSK